MPINTSVYQDNQSLKVSAYIVNPELFMDQYSTK